MSTWHLQWAIHCGGGGELAQFLGRRFQRGTVLSRLLCSRSYTSDFSNPHPPARNFRAKSETYIFVFFRARLRRGKGKNSQEQMHPP